MKIERGLICMFSEKKFVQKITGAGIDDLVLQLHDARAKVFEAAEKAKTDPKAKAGLDEARIAYALAEAALEKAKAEHQGLVALTQLLAAMTTAGKDAYPIRKAMVDLLKDEPAQAVPAKAEAPARQTPTPQAQPKAKAPVQPAPAQSVPAQPAQQAAPAQSQAQAAQANGDGTETGVFTVLETRAGKSPGTVRAYCQAIGSDQKVAVYGKNGNGQVLAGAVGKTVAVKYRQGEKGLIAVNVQVAG